MGRAPLALLLLVLAAPAGSAAAPAAQRGTAARAAQASSRAARTPASKGPRKVRPARGSALEKARAAMKAVTADRTKRRYRHQWERGIAGLLRAAKGRDAQPALLDAARARYALYRWSANEGDRDEALRLATRAAKMGSRDAAGLAAAIRREAGDDRPRPKRRPAPNAPPDPVAPEPADDVQDSEPDPALEAALADAGASAPPALALGLSGGEGTARVTGVRSWSNDEYTRVAIYLSHWVGWQKLELAADGLQPRRLALDFRPASLGEAFARPVAGLQINRLRAAQNDPQTVRVVLDLPGEQAVSLFGLEDPPRLVIDVGHTGVADVGVARATPSPGANGETANGSAAGAAEGETKARSTVTALPEATETVSVRRVPSHDGGRGAPASRAPARRAPARIVVDAGHGGHDPGAIGPRRVREKDVTLAIAKRLAKRLRAAGFEVVLTRKDDRYLALEERTAIANTAQADLFVSVHANAHPRRNRRGVETYYLNVADDRYAARLAARENGVDLGERGEGDVSRILTDLDAKASAGASRRLASLVQEELTTGVRARVGEVRDLGVKGALFYVLLGARMPAVLVETAFISNRDEERRLASARYQEEVAAGIARAVSAFARSEARVAAVR